MLCLVKGEEQAKSTAQALEYYQMRVHVWRRISCQHKTSSISSFLDTAYLQQKSATSTYQQHILYNDVRWLMQITPLCGT